MSHPRLDEPTFRARVRVYDENEGLEYSNEGLLIKYIVYRSCHSDLFKLTFDCVIIEVSRTRNMSEKLLSIFE